MPRTPAVTYYQGLYGMEVPTHDAEVVLFALRNVKGGYATSEMVELATGLSRPDVLRTLVSLRQRCLAKCTLRGGYRTRYGVTAYGLPPLWSAREVDAEARDG